MTSAHDPAAPLQRVRVQLLPWRRRSRVFTDVPDLPVPSGDDPVSAVLGLVVLLVLLPFLLIVAVTVALLGVELLVLLSLAPLLLLGRVLGLQPWVLRLRYADGTVRTEQVHGVRALRERRRELRASLR